MPYSATVSSENAIVVTVDSDYFQRLCLFLRSLEQNYPSHPDVVICYQGITTRRRSLLKESFSNIIFLNIDNQEFSQGPGMQHKEGLSEKEVFYSRIILWTDLFSEYNTILYLDVDLVVLAPLDALFETSSFDIAPDSYQGPDPVLYADQSEKWLPLLEGDEIADRAGRPAANAGVFAVARPYRTREQLQRLEYIIERYGPYFAWGDQSMFNIWMWMNDLTPNLDYRFNFQARLFEQNRKIDAFSEARILHFNGYRHTRLVPHLMRAATLMSAMPGGRTFFMAYFRLLRSRYGIITRSYLRKLKSAVTKIYGRP